MAIHTTHTSYQESHAKSHKGTAMRTKLSLLVLSSFILLSCFSLAETGFSQDIPGNKPERLEWLKDAGFGMFIHWSMDSQLGSVISHSLVGASDDYVERYFNELPQTFNPKKYDPEDWVVLAKLAGMKYVVFTTKHHSGFCMWDTETTDFNIMHTPYGKDIVADYVRACRKHGLAVGFYFSPEDFRFLHQNGIMIARNTPEADPNGNEAYLEYLQAQIRELMTRYGDIDVVFFDGKGSESLKQICWEIHPGLLVTRGAINTPEQTLPGVFSDEPWEACVTMGTQWQYKPTHDDYKSGTRLIELLIETRAKGGSLLLNVGPKPDGELPIEQEARLREMALWNFINKEAVEGVRPWIISNEENIWYTRKGNTVYAFLTKLGVWDKGERKAFVLGTVKATENTTISILGQSGKHIEYMPSTFDISAQWNQADDGLHISVVRAQRVYNNTKWHNPVVVKLENVEPALVVPRFETTGEENAAHGSAVLTGRLSDIGDADMVEAGFEYRVYPGFAEDLYFEEWEYTEMVRMSSNGAFEMKIDGLEKGVVYQFRAVIQHPLVKMYGNIRRFTAD